MANLVTHDGVFHCDDIFAYVVLKIIYPVHTLTRTRNNDIIEDADIVFDVGGIYDSHDLLFDHHQKGGVVIDGRSYSSVGLIWKEYGEETVKALTKGLTYEQVKEVAFLVDQKLIAGIDYIDTGEFMKNKDNFSTPQIFNVSNIISLMNPIDGSDFDYSFFEASVLAFNILNNLVLQVSNSVKLKNEIKLKVESSRKRQLSYVILDPFIPWRDVVNLKEHGDMQRFIFPYIDGNWIVQQTKWANPFPEKWRGLTKEELRKETGISDMTFCHNAGFICGTETIKSAIYIAENF